MTCRRRGKAVYPRVKELKPTADNPRGKQEDKQSNREGLVKILAVPMLEQLPS